MFNLLIYCKFGKLDKNVQLILLYGCEVCFDYWYKEFNIVFIWILMLFKVIIYGKFFFYVNFCSFVGSSVVIIRQDCIFLMKSLFFLELFLILW